MNTIYFIIQQTMFFAIPLLIVGLGALYSEKSGVSNIGLEGIMIIGAFAGILTINTLGNSLDGQLLFVIAIVIAAIVGGLFSLLHAWTSIRLLADQTISGTAINLFAPAFCIFITRTLYGTKQLSFVDKFFINKVPILGDIPIIGECLFTNTYISTYIGIILLIVFNFILNKTVFGLRLSSCGENPNAAASVGISVTKMRYIGVILSGLLGGAGGLIFVVTTSTTFSATVAGYGFLALAVLILAQWKPLGILFASLFFGLMKAISSTYSGISFLAELNINSEIYKMMPYILTIVVLIISSKNSYAPKAVSVPYDDGTGFSNSNLNKKTIIISRITKVILFILVTLLIVNFATEKNKTSSISSGFGADVAFVMEVDSSIDDKSFCQDIWEGMANYSKESNKTIKYYKAKNSSDDALYDCIKIAILGNAKTIILPNDTYGNVLHKIQYEYPDVNFIFLDKAIVDENGNEDINNNVICLKAAEEQAGFLAGYAAVMDGYRSLGFMGGMALSSVIDYGYGFAQGAEYAGEVLGLKKGEISLKYCYTGVFEATPEVLAMASSWYRSGTEVIFGCGGLLGNAVMKAAETNNGKVIGVDTDQSNESNTVITSAMKSLDECIYLVLKMNDRNELKFGSAEKLTTAQEVVCLPMETSRFKNFTQQQYDEIYSKLANDEIEILTSTDVSIVTDLPLTIVDSNMIY